MNILIAMDSFKGSLTSMQAGDAVREGILRVDSNANVIVRPLADGGEGTVQALVDGMGGELVSVRVTGSLGEEVCCEYGIIQFKNCVDCNHNKGKTDIYEAALPGEICAIIEIAGAAGLTLVPESKRNPMYTTTYGVGEVIRDAIGRGCRHFIIGIGGSATNDGGVGMMQALGVHFLDREGNEIERGGAGLERLKSIDTSHMLPELSECKFRIACDVDNPLCGENGCSAVFAPQKGAFKEDIMKMDKWLSHYKELVLKSLKTATHVHVIDAELSKDSLPIEKARMVVDNMNTDHPGDGAAGGLGFAFRTFLHGELVSGSRLIIEETGLKDYIEKADIIITGEGCLDGQTVMGKAPISVARLAKECNNADKVKKVIAFAGRLGDGVEKCLLHGIDAYYAIEYDDYLHKDIECREVELQNIVNESLNEDRSSNQKYMTIPDDVMKPEIAGKFLADTVEKVFRKEGLSDVN